MFSEQMSSVAARAQLEAALDYCREGDTLVVTKLDRLARSARHLSELVDALEAKGVTLRILNFGGDAVDTRGATGRLMLNMFAAMAQFEREMMLERQREGIAKAKAEGQVQGPETNRTIEGRSCSPHVPRRQAGGPHRQRLGDRSWQRVSSP
jgi:DNA invertase Pin-like site-specific DNA recombinase